MTRVSTPRLHSTAGGASCVRTSRLEYTAQRTYTRCRLTFHDRSVQMPLSIFEYGDGRFRLFHDSREVGWVEERVIGFSGYQSDAAAVRAATVAYDALN